MRTRAVLAATATAAALTLAAGCAGGGGLTGLTGPTAPTSADATPTYPAPSPTPTSGPDASAPAAYLKVATAVNAATVTWESALDRLGSDPTTAQLVAASRTYAYALSDAEAALNDRSWPESANDDVNRQEGLAAESAVDLLDTSPTPDEWVQKVEADEAALAKNSARVRQDLGLPAAGSRSA